VTSPWDQARLVGLSWVDGERDTMREAGTSARMIRLRTERGEIRFGDGRMTQRRRRQAGMPKLNPALLGGVDCIIDLETTVVHS
jgi:hypothetical protein